MPQPLGDTVEAVRRFNRFYTRYIGVLQEHILDSPFSLAQARLLYELAHHDGVTATELAAELGLDAGYVSRTLRGFQHEGWLGKTPSSTDGRRTLLALTGQGRAVFEQLDQASNQAIMLPLQSHSAEEQKQLKHALSTIQRLLGGGAAEARVPYILRPHQPGDMGWVVHRHGVLYAEEYGWDERFEALVAQIVAGFIQKFNPRRERCWMAEVDGAVAGSVFLVEKSKTIAQLRLLLVEPSARGLGIGSRLVNECIVFARRTGYRKMLLWTNDVLHSARHIYERAGFELVSEERHNSFGADLVGQTWQLKL